MLAVGHGVDVRVLPQAHVALEHRAVAKLVELRQIAGHAEAGATGGEPELQLFQNRRGLEAAGLLLRIGDHLDERDDALPGRRRRFPDRQERLHAIRRDRPVEPRDELALAPELGLESDAGFVHGLEPADHVASPEGEEHDDQAGDGGEHGAAGDAAVEPFRPPGHGGILRSTRSGDGATRSHRSGRVTSTTVAMRERFRPAPLATRLDFRLSRARSTPGCAG